MAVTMSPASFALERKFASLCDVVIVVAVLDDVFVIVCDGSKCRHVYDKRTNKLHSLVILLQDWAIVHVPLGHAASFVSYSN
jgi:hypothetical protein